MMPTRVSLAELIDADVSLRPDEAVAIVREVCRQHADGTLRGIPNATVIRLTPEGRIVVEGPVSRDQDPVRAAAALLSDLLPGFHSPTGFKVPGGLRLVLARATRTLDLPPFADVAAFCGALERFATADSGEAVRHLFNAWLSRHVVAAEPHRLDLTISDVRRARRATGLSLDEISHACGIPTERLRELEWGYLRNWTADEHGRDALRRYARAAGVDEDVVLSVAWPLVETAALEPAVEVVAAGPAERPEPQPTWALVPVAARDRRAPLRWPARKPEPLLGNHRWLVALAAAVVLVIAVLALGWERATPALVQADSRREPEAVVDTPAVATTGPEVPAKETRETPRAAVVNASMKSAAPRPRVAKAKARPADSPRRSFLKRELFRIVIK